MRGGRIADVYFQLENELSETMGCFYLEYWKKLIFSFLIEKFESVDQKIVKILVFFDKISQKAMLLLYFAKADEIRKKWLIFYTLEQHSQKFKLIFI